MASVNTIEYENVLAGLIEPEDYFDSSNGFCIVADNGSLYLIFPVLVAKRRTCLKGFRLNSGNTWQHVFSTPSIDNDDTTWATIKGAVSSESNEMLIWYVV